MTTSVYRVLSHPHWANAKIATSSGSRLLAANFTIYAYTNNSDNAVIKCFEHLSNCQFSKKFLYHGLIIDFPFCNYFNDNNEISRSRTLFFVVLDIFVIQHCHWKSKSSLRYLKYFWLPKKENLWFAMETIKIGYYFKHSAWRRLNLNTVQLPGLGCRQY